MKKKTYIKPESTVIEPLCKDEIIDGLLHGASYDIDGEGGGRGSSQEGIPDKWEDEDYDNETTTPTSIFDH